MGKVAKEETLQLTNKVLISIANHLGAYTTDLTWGAIRDMVRNGTIGDILQAGDQVSVDHSSTLSVSLSEDAGITAASVDADTFLAAAGTSTYIYAFSYDGTNWNYNGNTILLTAYGITVTGTPVSGDVITINRSATSYDFNVEGIDQMQTVNENLTHNLAIQMDDLYIEDVFDVPQYLWACTAESLSELGISGSVLPAGDYSVTLLYGSYNSGTNEDGTYYFTTTVDIPIGGGIRHTYMGSYQSSSSSYSQAKVLDGTFETYAADTITTLETEITCSTTAISGATSLGTTTARDPQYKTSDYLNFTQRQKYGSDRWSTSRIRQWLNSNDSTFAWTPATIFSRNRSASVPGYRYGIDTELNAVLARTRTRYALGISDGYGYEDVEDYVTLGTLLDVFGQTNNDIAEGPVTSDGEVTRTTATDYWQANDDEADRIKYLGSSAEMWWLSSVYLSDIRNVRSVSSTGALSSYSANGSRSVCPRLTIA